MSFAAENPRDEDGTPVVCEDRDDRWQVHGTSCEKMSAMCDDDSYGELVQAWCPVTCKRCEPSFKSQGEKDVETDRKDVELEVMPDAGDNASSVNFLEDLAGDNAHSALRNATAVEGSTTGKAILLLEELEETTLTDSNDRLPMIASQFEVLGKDPFSVSFVKMEANQSHSFRNASRNATNATGKRHEGLIAKILDLLSPTKVEVEENTSACPEGWEQVIGDVYGGDQFSGGYTHSAKSIDDCAWRCLKEPGCGSFEWSPSQKKCFRNSQTRPTHEEARGDFLFCRRQPCPRFKTKEACVGPGIASGYYSKEVSMRPGSYCIWSAGHCQAPMACTDRDCFLPDGGLPGMKLPNRYTLWISRLGLQATMAL
ncbi:unnamed protein product [Durusdinium trenchii]|uniref:Apple domain-containing protein n=1 Tax=Durusdinium trenchii TaxID=1381693 RepID=A0ABP0M7X6_9DINO